MTLALILIIAIIIIGIQIAVPFLVKRTVIFGVTIPEKHIHHEQLTAYKKRYALFVTILSIVALSSYLIWVLTNNPSEEQTVLIGTSIEFGIILFSLSLYFYFHGKMIGLKRKNGWGENVKQVKIADLSVRAQDEMLPWHLYLLPMIITVGIIGYSILQYDLMPNQIPTHWDIQGNADAFTEKTPTSAVLMPLTLLFMQIMFLGIQVGTKKSGIKLSANATNASRIRQLTLRKYTSWLMFFVSLLLTIMFSLFQLKTIHPNIFDGIAVAAAPIIFITAVLASTIAFAIKVGRSDKISVDVTEEETTDFDEDIYWKGGLFYFNRKDPSIFVEKRFGVGWTLNFGNPIGYLIVLVPLVIILVFNFM